MTPLHKKLVGIIRREGPIGVDRYMALCLGDPEHGYYRTRDPLGARGDFVTSPEISQMFGELIGVWMATAWRAMGAPAEVNLVELGPGRGTLMSDALRALRALPEMSDAARVHLVETSPALHEKQRAALAGCGAPVRWHDAIDTVPHAPIIVVANEFFDALPIRQFIRRGGAWRERLVACDEQDALIFVEAKNDDSIGGDAAEGEIREEAPASLSVIPDLARRVSRDGGAALVIDYGPLQASFGDTLQAMRAHEFVLALENPGECDLTAHVNFTALLDAARNAGAAAQGPVTQAAFLTSMGIATRARALSVRASDEQKLALAAGLARLTDVKNARAMGALFKAIALRDPKLPPMPGFNGEPS